MRLRVRMGEGEGEGFGDGGGRGVGGESACASIPVLEITLTGPSNDAQRLTRVSTFYFLRVRDGEPPRGVDVRDGFPRSRTFGTSFHRGDGPSHEVPRHMTTCFPPGFYSPHTRMFCLLLRVGCLLYTPGHYAMPDSEEVALCSYLLLLDMTDAFRFLVLRRTAGGWGGVSVSVGARIYIILGPHYQDHAGVDSIRMDVM